MEELDTHRPDGGSPRVRQRRQQHRPPVKPHPPPGSASNVAVDLVNRVEDLATTRDLRVRGQGFHHLGTSRGKMGVQVGVGLGLERTTVDPVRGEHSTTNGVGGERQQQRDTKA